MSAIHMLLYVNVYCLHIFFCECILCVCGIVWVIIYIVCYTYMLVYDCVVSVVCIYSVCTVCQLCACVEGVECICGIFYVVCENVECLG